MEVCSNGVWGTVCDGGRWDSRDATVVCRQLRFQHESEKRNVTYTFRYTFKHSTPTVSYKGLELVVCYSIVLVSGRNGRTVETIEL